MAIDWQTLVPFQVRAGTWPQGIIGFISFQGAGSVQGSATRSSSYLALAGNDEILTSFIYILEPTIGKQKPGSLPLDPEVEVGVLDVRHAAVGL